METRWNVNYAAAWRIATELLRRHKHSHQLKLLFAHPGGGQYQCLTIAAPGTQHSVGKHLCYFNIGSGNLAVFETLGQPRARFEELGWPETRSYALAMLQAEDPKAVVDQVEALLGLPRVQAPPPLTTPSTLVLRAVASLLERQMLARQRTDLRSAWCDNSAYGCSIYDWIRAVPEERGLPDRALQSPEVAHVSLAARVWRLSLAAESQQGCVIDLKTATVYGPAGEVCLWDVYQASGRSLPVVVNRLTDEAVGHL